MSSPSARRRSQGGVAAVCFGLVAGPLVLMPPAEAATDGSQVVINEVYGGGGNSGATLKNDFIELYNPTGSPISLGGMSLQYRSATGTGAPGASNVVALSGSIAPKGYWLLQAAAGTGGTDELPTPDQVSTLGMGGTGGQVFLVNGTAPVDPGTGNIATTTTVLDFVGYGSTAASYETTRTAAVANATSAGRTTAGVDSNNNSADFAVGTPTPQNSAPAGGGQPEPPAPQRVTIEEIQGTGATSPLVGTTVTTRGVVTASYPTGGYKGFYIQTPGTGGPVDPASHTGSNALFVYLGSAAAAAYPAAGSYVEVTGPVSEFSGTTQVSPAAADVHLVDETVPAPAPAQVGYPTTEEARESFEGMLLAPQGAFTVTDNYSLNQYGEIGLAQGTKPLRQPTDVARPLSAEAVAVDADNKARGVKLDDGSSTNFLSSSNMDIPLPYLTTADPVRVGAKVTFTRPVVLEYRNSAWKFQPTEQLTAGNAGTVQPATFENTRTAAPEAVGGDLQIASFNVLNYFIETGADYEADGGTCSYYNDRAGNRITVRSCNGEGPRGAADRTNLARQQAKIVAAINALGAEVVSLEEIENSAKFAGDSRRDDALATLVDALNADAGSPVWAFVPSPAVRPALADEDVIRTAFIYRKAAVEPVGPSRILNDTTAFSNARKPLAQVFKPAGGSARQQFLVIVNHFKSKGSGPSSGENADKGDGQGAWNAARVAQAQALVAFAAQVQQDTGTEQTFLSGDFNAYTHEDPMQVLYDAGYVNIGAAKTSESTYLFGGLVGSLDHILANQAAFGHVTGADVWNINSVEPVALEYSRHNYNATDFYEVSPYRSSDHDPLVVGYRTVDRNVAVNLLNINDFHGRIDSNTTRFATTVEKLRAEAGEKNTLFLSAGDNIGASLFASASADDEPTIDVLNALALRASAVGNHEFDQGVSDLTGRVAQRSDFGYLGANVYDKTTGKPILEEFRIFTVDGVRVGVIGAVTEETPALVTPSGIADVAFGDPVQAVNRVAGQLSDGDPANGEADLLVAEYHEGARDGIPEGSSLEQEVADGGAFAQIVNGTSAEVDAIFTGHTHKQYAWQAKVPGAENQTRPIVQTGSYGEYVGQIVLSYDSVTGEVSTSVVRNVARATAQDLSYPRVQAVKTIVDKALAAAQEKGSVPVGSVVDQITRAIAGGSYVDGRYTGGSGDDRAAESTLGNLVADSLVDSLSAPGRGGAEIGVVNPGGLRAELDPNKDKVVTYAEANAVLPFVNNLWTLSLTGAQFKQVLEQQWQRDANGNVPSRPFLHLGLSSNVSTTLDPSRPEGDRVTSIRVNGVPLDPAKMYRIGTFSFLATGGDNFRAFKSGTNVKDSGLIDRDAWITYLQGHRDLAPVFARRQLYATDLPSAVRGGDGVSFGLTRLDLTSHRSPQNTTVSAVLSTPTGTRPLGEFPVSNGAATVSFTAPAEIPAGSSVVLTAAPSGTTLTIPAVATPVTPPPPPAPAATITTATLVDGPVVVDQTRATVRVRVTAGETPADGTVEVREGETLLGSAALVDGTADVVLPRFASTGSRTLSVAYLGSDSAAPSATTVVLDVVKATSSVTASVSGPVVVGQTRPSVGVRVTAGETPADGTVEVREGGSLLGSAELTDGTADIRLPHFASTGSRTLSVAYLGSDSAAPSATTVDVDVVKATPELTARVLQGVVHAGKTRPKLRIVLAAPGQTVTGRVLVTRAGEVLDRVVLENGKGTAVLPAFRDRGERSVVVTYLGSGSAESVSEKVTIRVVR